MKLEESTVLVEVPVSLGNLFKKFYLLYSAKGIFYCCDFINSEIQGGQ